MSQLEIVTEPESSVCERLLRDPGAEHFVTCVKAMLDYAEGLFRLRQDRLGRQLLRIIVITIHEFERAEFDRSKVAERVELRNLLFQTLDERFGHVISVRPYFQYLQRENHSALD
jgi:hypothetical protein